MLPKYHVLLGVLFCIILYPLFKINVILIFLAAVFIDFDHYLRYLITNNDTSLKNAYKFHLTGEFHNILDIFHTIEVFILLVILSFYSNLFYFILIGVTFHQIFDLIDLIYKKWYDARAYSLIFWLKNKYENK